MAQWFVFEWKPFPPYGLAFCTGKTGVKWLTYSQFSSKDEQMCSNLKQVQKSPQWQHFGFAGGLQDDFEQKGKGGAVGWPHSLVAVYGQAWGQVLALSGACPIVQAWVCFEDKLQLNFMLWLAFSMWLGEPGFGGTTNKYNVPAAVKSHALSRP